MKPLAIVVTLLALMIVSLPAQRAEFELDEGQRTLAAQALNVVSRPMADQNDALESLYAAGHRAAAILGVGSRHAALISKALGEAADLETGDIESRVSKLRAALTASRDALAFRPVAEAETPKGWPSFTTIGEVEFKTYPKHRLARTDMKSAFGETRGFWTLFQHIKSNEIAMTTPVEMRYDEKDGMQPMTMAFLYGDTAIGEAGSEGKVEVIDIEEFSAISIGLNGYRSDERAAKATKLLEAWLERNARLYERAGPIRVMGWNGPQVRGAKRFFEVQIPVKKRAKAIVKGG